MIDAEGARRRPSRRSYRHAPQRQARPIYTPHVDCGDNIIVVNAEKVGVHRPQAERQDLLLAHRLSRRHQGAHAAPDPGRASSPSASLEKAVERMLRADPLQRQADAQSARSTRAPSIRTTRRTPRSSTCAKLNRKNVEGLIAMAKPKPSTISPSLKPARYARAKRLGARPRRRSSTSSGPRLRHRQAQERRGPRLDQARQGQDHRQRQGLKAYFARPVLQMLLAAAAQAANRLDQFDIIRHGEGRRPVRPGRRGASRHLQGAHLLRAGAAAAC